MCEAQRPGKLRFAGGVRGIHANTMRVEDAKKAAKPAEGGSSAPKVGPLTLVQASPTMLSTVSLSVRKQLDDKWAAAFYEFGLGIPFEVASSLR
jgi:hypothetical protein